MSINTHRCVQSTWMRGGEWGVIWCQACVIHSISFCINHHLLPSAWSCAALSPFDFLTSECYINLSAACLCGRRHSRKSNPKPQTFFLHQETHYITQHYTPSRRSTPSSTVTGAYCSRSSKWISNSVILAKLPFSLLQTSPSQTPFPLCYWLWLEVIALKEWTSGCVCMCL